MINDRLEAILAADFGSAMTTLILIERRGEAYHLAAWAETSSTYRPPWFDITIGLLEAIKEIEAKTGRTLLSKNGTPIVPQTSSGDGADAFVAVTSAASPVAVTLAGLTRQLSMESARRTVTSTYGLVSHQIDLENRAENRQLETQITGLQRGQSDLILLVGGIDGGVVTPVVDLAYIISMALRVMKPNVRPEVIYAGNSQIRADIAEILGGLTTFKSVNNIRPRLDVENLTLVQEEINRLYLERKVTQVAGAKTLLNWLEGGIVPTAKSFAQMIRYLGRSYEVKVLGVDIGSATTTVTVSRDDFHTTTTRADLGIGSQVDTLLEEVGDVDNFIRWLPFEMTGAGFKNFVLNKALFPQTVPQTYRDFWLEMATVREALRVVSLQAQESWGGVATQENGWFNWDWIIGSGRALTRMADPVRAALMLLDGLEPVGICRLILDKLSISGMMGSVAAVQPLAAAQLAEEALQFEPDSPFVNLGMVIAPVGVGRPGALALRLQINYEDGRKVEKKVPFGTLEVVPLDVNEEVRLKIRPARNFNLTPQWGLPGEEVEVTVRGGLLGLIIDVRGRPIAWAQDEEGRRQQLQTWLAAIDPEKAVEAEDPVEVEPYVA